MKQIKKKDLKEVIRLTKLWYDCDDSNVVSYHELWQARVKAFGSSYTSPDEIVVDVYRLKGKKATLKTYYKVLEALGYELV